MGSNKPGTIVTFAGVLALVAVWAWFITTLAESKPPLQVGRFQMSSPGSNAAFDTATGKMCWLYDPIGQGSEKIPLCSSLVK